MPVNCFPFRCIRIIEIVKNDGVATGGKRQIAGIKAEAVFAVNRVVLRETATVGRSRVACNREVVNVDATNDSTNFVVAARGYGPVGTGNRNIFG